ncbi:MAG: hypothetical protein ACRD3V_33230 [Vicinamibacteria bacterium]
MRENLRWLWNPDAAPKNPRVEEAVLFLTIALVLGALAYVRIGHNLVLAVLAGVGAGFLVVSNVRHRRRDPEGWRMAYRSRHWFEILCTFVAVASLALAVVLGDWHLLLSAVIFGGIAIAIYAAKRSGSSN